jgi:HAE1 family hydrophobic/amphiphilic exporter-1
VVQVSGSYTGADAQTVEQTVVAPVESQVNGTPGMAYLKSNSTSSGRMTVDVTFDIGTNIDIAALEVQNRVSIATPQLPDDVRRLGLTVRKRNPSLLMVVSLQSPKETHGVKFLDNYANTYVRDALLRVKGVGDISSVTDDFSMRIWLKPDKLAQLGLTAGEVIAALQEQNVQVAAGSVGAPPQRSSQAFEYTVFVNGRLANATDFDQIIVYSKPEDGSIVYLKDVARVELGKFGYANNNFVDGKRASFLIVFQTPGSNALDIGKGS